MDIRATCTLLYYYRIRIFALYRAQWRRGWIQNHLYGIFSIFGRNISTIVEHVASDIARILAIVGCLFHLGCSINLYISARVIK